MMLFTIHALIAATPLLFSGPPSAVRAYADAEATRLFRQAERAGERMRHELDERATVRCLQELVDRGLHPARGPESSAPSDGAASADSIVRADERARAVAAIGAIEDPMELACAFRVLGGQERSPNLIERDPEVRRALFTAMSREARFGQVKLVELAVTESDPVRQRAHDALPERLSSDANARLCELLGADRELHINRAASIASAHAAAELIPALVNAQYAPPKQTVGDEAWIAIGRTSHYIQNQIPVTGDSSTSFQPVVGTLFEGSLLRIMESKVEIFRTEVHESLAMVVERTTGKPAPPYGYDRERWLSWYREEFPRLAAAHAMEQAIESEAARTRSTPVDRDG